jgi:hypothetical protein
VWQEKCPRRQHARAQPTIIIEIGQEKSETHPKNLNTLHQNNSSVLDLGKVLASHEVTWLIFKKLFSVALKMQCPRRRRGPSSTLLLVFSLEEERNNDQEGNT